MKEQHMAKKLLPPNITIWWVPDPPGINNVNTPTVAEINAGVNISCAMTADFTLGWTERDTDDTAGLCDDANVQNPLRKNYEATLTFFLDENPADVTSIYNQTLGMFRTPLKQGYLVQRIGGNPRTKPNAVAGDLVTVFKVISGDPTIINDPAAPIQMEIVFYAQGVSSNGIVPVVTTGS